MITDAERRARVAQLHGLGAAHRHTDLAAATDAMSAWHATEPSSVHLAAHARAEGVRIEDVETALYDARSLVKVMAMRRTQFVVPCGLYPAVVASAGSRVAQVTQTQLAKRLRESESDETPEAWLAAATADVQALLGDGNPLSSKEIGVALPELGRRVVANPGTKWSAPMPLSSVALVWMWARGLIVRARNGGDWKRAAPRWTTPELWFGEAPAQLDEQAGYAALVATWLRSFGPGTEADIVWWLGSTETVVRRALVDVGAEQVALSDGRTGWLHPQDVDPVAEPDPWAALVPVLDPSVMGWRERDFYLESAHTPYLFDSVGNAAATAWVDGRIVGGWVQDEDGRVRVITCTDVPASRRRLLDTEAERLTTLLDGQRISSPYTAALAKGVALG